MSLNAKEQHPSFSYQGFEEAVTVYAAVQAVESPEHPLLQQTVPTGYERATLYDNLYAPKDEAVRTYIGDDAKTIINALYIAASKRDEVPYGLRAGLMLQIPEAEAEARAAVEAMHASSEKFAKELEARYSGQPKEKVISFKFETPQLIKDALGKVRERRGLVLDGFEEAVVAHQAVSEFAEVEPELSHETDEHIMEVIQEAPLDDEKVVLHGKKARITRQALERAARRGNGWQSQAARQILHKQAKPLGHHMRSLRGRTQPA